MPNLGALSRKHWVCDSRKDCCIWSRKWRETWMHWGSSKVGPAALPFYIVSVNAFPEHITRESYPGRWSQLNSDLTHDWSQSLKFLIRVGSQHSWHCTFSPQMYAHQLSLSAMIWASEFLIIWCYNRISFWPHLEWQACAAMSPSEGHTRCLIHMCATMWDKNPTKTK